MTGSKRLFSLYVHIPLCLKKCRYCAFNSFAILPGMGREALIVPYLQALVKELDLVASALKEYELKTIYFGGGTPTILSPQDLRFVLEACRRNFNWNGGIEITIEANPGTVSPLKLKELRCTGINRISLGAQSFRTAELKLLGRIHSVADIYSAFEGARSAGFENINLDLIYGIPGQEVEVWRNNLNTAIALNPEHLSVYGLSLEEGTPLADDVEKGRLTPCDEETQVAMWKETSRLLREAGYERYEIANFARPGYMCCHNLTYWMNEPYLGVGAGAHGFIEGVRYANCADLREYMELLKENRLPRSWEERQTIEQERKDTVIMGLRLVRGISCSAFRERFGASFEEIYSQEIASLEEQGLLEWEGDFVFLTDRGRLLANHVLACFV